MSGEGRSFELVNRELSFSPVLFTMANYTIPAECMSSMEEECLIEKRRSAILKECSDLLKLEGSSRYGRDAFRKLFQDEVIRYLSSLPPFHRISLNATASTIFIKGVNACRQL